jgi:iron complex outermembrane receptor protein
MWTYDIDVQHSFAWGERQEIVWGGGFRRFRSHFDNAAGTEFHPATTEHNLGNFFVQDTIAISDAVKLTLGTKFEDDPFVGIEILPSGRLSWKTPDGTLLWASVSRAVRAPSLWDRDLHQIVDGFTLLAGGRFKSETVVAYEAGYRGQPLENLTLSVSAYYNVYDRLRSVEFSPGPAFPLVYANLVEGDVYGVEIWGTWQVMENWRVSAGANLMHQDLRFKKGSFQLTGFEILGNDPDEQYFLRSSWSFAPGFDFDIDARYVAELPNPHVPSYVGLNARLAYHVNERIDVVLRGENLAGAHREFGPFATAPEFEPAAFLALEWRS